MRASLEGHLTATRRDAFTRTGAQPIRELPHLKHGQKIKIDGLIVARQHPPTAKGFCFLADEVPDGMVNVVVPPGVLFLSGKFCPGDLGRHAGDLPLLNLEYDHGIAIIPPREFLRPFGPPPGPQPSLLPWYGELAAIGQAGFVDWQSRE